MLPHAPQFLRCRTPRTRPNVDQVRKVGVHRRKAEGVEAGPLDHLLERSRRAVLPQRRPALHRHVGGEATGEFAGRKFHWKIPSEISFEIVRQLYRQNFDPAFTSTARIDYAIGIP